MIDEAAVQAAVAAATPDLASMEQVRALHQQVQQLAAQIATPPSDWALHLGGQPMMRPTAGKEPCGFYRLMQRLFLGLDWRKVA